jgi:hypothetical protein
MQGTDPREFYPGKATDRALAQNIKDTYGDVDKGTRCYKVASIYNGRSAPSMSINRWKVDTQELTHTGHGLCRRSHGEVCRRLTDELGEVPSQSTRTRLSRSAGSWLRVSLQLAPNPHHLCFLGDARRCDLPGYRSISVDCREVRYTFVLKKYEQTVAVECCFSYVIPSTEESHRI